MTWGTIKSAVDWISCNAGERDEEKDLTSPVVFRDDEGFKTCLYYSSWSVYKNHPPQDINLHYVTNVFFAFFNLQPNGEVIVGDQWADLDKPFPALNQSKYGKTHFKGLLARFFEIKNDYRGIKVSMSIGGWSNRDRFSECMKNERCISKLLDSAVWTMLEYGFDGIDLDWEYPEDQAEANLYLRLIARLRTALRRVEDENKIPRDTFLLTMACPALTDKLEYFPIEEMDKYLSFWNMMTYDFAGQGWSEKAGYHCNLFKKHEDDLCGHDSIIYMLGRGVHPRKLMLGMANYGRSFANTKGYGHPFQGSDPLSEDGIFNYNKLPLPGSKEKYDSKGVVAYCYSPETRTFVSYDSVESVSAKARYVDEKKLGGGMFWESLGDRNRNYSHSLLLTFVAQLGGTKNLDRQLNNLKGYGESQYLSKQFKDHMPI